MAKKTFIGTCSKCKEKKGVIRARGVQLCGICIGQLDTYGNLDAFSDRPKPYRKRLLGEQS